MSRLSTLKVASVQMVSTPDTTRNFACAQKWIEIAADQGAKLVVLPEYFCLFGHSDKDKLKIQEPLGQGPMQEMLAKLAEKNQIYLVAGSLPIQPSLKEQQDKVWNASLVFNPLGKVHAHYNKIHLFSFRQGDENYDEGRTLLAGTKPCTFELDEAGQTWKFGLSICYDIRFPELYRQMGEVDAQVIPAAFTHTTGSAHWEILLRARAIENQCYFIASAQGGLHENGRRTWGQSLITDPWGEIQSSLDEGEGLVLGELSKDLLKEVRLKLPALNHRKK